MKETYQLVSVNDYEKHAKSVLPKLTLDYYMSGAGDEMTLSLNKTAFANFRIRPRFLRDVSSRSLSTRVLGCDVTMPLGIAPTAMQKMAHPEGEVANARAAGAAGTIFILSTLSTSSIEEVAAGAPHTHKWFQLYIYKDRAVTMELVKRAEACGFKAVVLTVDAPIFGIRRRDVQNNFALPPHLTLANFEGMKATKINESGSGSSLSVYVNSLFDQSLTWADIEWLKGITSLPIVLKGVLTAEDAVLGVEAGASAILVSNHGARQLDFVPAGIEALPEIVKAVGDRCDVYLDGGIRSGTDIFISLALGAKMVFMGRPALWGLARGGERGVVGVLELLRKELDVVMCLTGCATLSDIHPRMVAPKCLYSQY